MSCLGQCVIDTMVGTDKVSCSEYNAKIFYVHSHNTIQHVYIHVVNHCYHSKVEET